MANTALAVRVTVTPSPQTFAESRAVFRQLRKHGALTTFIKHHPAREGVQDGNVETQDVATTYYAVYSAAPTSLLANSDVSFDVRVHHDLPDPQVVDPYNVRGLQNRKPSPQPKTLKCKVEHAKKWAEISSMIVRANPCRGSYQLGQPSVLTTIMRQTGAPPGTWAALSHDVGERDIRRTGETEKSFGQGSHRGQRVSTPTNELGQFKMKSLMALWRDGGSQ